MFGWNVIHVFSFFLFFFSISYLFFFLFRVRLAADPVFAESDVLYLGHVCRSSLTLTPQWRGTPPVSLPSDPSLTPDVMAHES